MGSHRVGHDQSDLAAAAVKTEAQSMTEVPRDSEISKIKLYSKRCGDFPCGLGGKESTCNADTWVQSLGWEDPLERATATRSSILA